MDKIKRAAIVMLGMGEKCAAEILKTMNPKEVQSVIEAINSIDNVSEEDVIKALNDFFKESNDSTGIDLVSREYLKNSLLSAVENSKIWGIADGMDQEKTKWLELFKWQEIDSIVAAIQDEHPQIITVILALIIPSEKSSRVIKYLPKDLQNNIVLRMSNLGPVSTFAMEALSTFFEKQLENTEKYHAVTVDGLEAVANMISYLDTEAERDIMTDLTNNNKNLSEKIQEKILPFERLAQLDKRSLQTLLNEVKSEDLAVALKGVDEYIKNIFFKCMSTKSAEILQDEIETKGPVKLAVVVDAQKKIVRLAKKLADEEKIILSTRNDGDVVF